MIESLLNAGVWLYARLARLLPPRMSERVGAELVRSFSDQCRDVARGGLVPLVGAWTRGFGNLMWTVVVEWWSVVAERAGQLGSVRRLEMGTVVQDLRYASRMLVKRPGTTALVILTLALGIGANTAIFSALRGSLLAELPYPDADELVMVWLNNERQGVRTDITSFPNYEATREQARTLQDLGVYVSGSWILGDEQPERVRIARLSANVFSILGVEAARGRVLEPREDVEGQERTVILGDGLWRRRYGGDPGVVGTRIQVGGEPATVVGVMPPGFDFPEDTEMWGPMSLSEDARTANAFWLYQIGRMRSDARLTTVQDEMNTIAGRLLEANPRLEGYHNLYVQPLKDRLVGEARTPLMLLAGAAGLVLLMACTNIVHLLLGRSASRERELSLRFALGATRPRVLTLLLIESVLLGIGGGALGVVTAYVGLGVLVQLGPDALTRLSTPSVDLPVLGFCLTLSVAVGVLVGLLPALYASGRNLSEALSDGGRGSAGVRRGQWLRRGLVATEVALALVLLVSAGLLLRSFDQVMSVDRGFDTAGVVTMDLSLSGTPLGGRVESAGFIRSLTEELGALPGVQVAAATSGILLPQLANSGWVSIEGQDDPPDEERIEVTFDMVTPGYFEAIGTEVVAGREILAGDDAEAIPVAVINEAMAIRYWSSAEDAINRRFGSPDQWITVVGVVEDSRRTSLEQTARPSAFLPHAQFGGGFMTVVARADPAVTSDDGALEALGPALQETVRRLGPGLPVGTVSTLEAELDGRLASRRFNTLLLVAFAAVALFLALVGIYGVVSQWVGERTQEIGVRMALGAERREVIGWVLRTGLGAPALGLVVGLGMSMLAARGLRSLLFQVDSLDPLTYAIAPLVVLTVAAAASLTPALRACRQHPSRVLHGK